MLGSSQSEIIKTLLYKPEGINIDGLSNHLQISRNATYQHVKSLERDGLITSHKVEKTKGRPGQTYKLTQKGRSTFTQSHAMIASLLVGAVKKKLGTAETTALFQQLGQDIAKDLVEELSILPLNERIEKISHVMASLGYETLLDPGDEDDPVPPRIIAHNCVFHDVAQEHSEVCEMDLALLSTLSNCRVDHQECIVKGGNVCRFAFVNKDKNEIAESSWQSSS